jgi:creatinine amidohydrolase/Fe(II)-dependent formamide hydrolase-like protein
MYLLPERVKMEKLKKIDVTYIPQLDPNYNGERPKIWKTIHYSNSGILGDPYHASKEKGEFWFQLLIEKINSLISKFIS